MSGIVTFVFKNGTAGHGSRSPPSVQTGGYEIFNSVFPIIFVFFLIDLPSEVSSSTPLILSL